MNAVLKTPVKSSFSNNLNVMTKRKKHFAFKARKKNIFLSNIQITGKFQNKPYLPPSMHKNA